MSAQYFVDLLTGYAVGIGIFVVVAALGKQRWIRQAHKLAAQSDIALPGLLVGPIARFLRNEFLFERLVTVLASALTATVLVGAEAHQYSATWFPAVLAGVPLFSAIVCFVLSLWPRWKASGGYRVTHLSGLTVSRAFTPAEFTAVLTGAVLTVALGAWGLWRVGAPATWWLACAAAMAVAAAAWRYAATTTMNRPSSASDATELGWDDLLRFRRVRAITAGTAWGSAAFVFLLVWAMTSAFAPKMTAPGEASGELQLWPIYVLIVVGSLVYGMFRQGRHQWRRAWQERDGSRP
jgi:hypothetical protein